MTQLHQSLPEWPEPLVESIRSSLLESDRTIVVLDDDPTGTQTVHDVPVLTSFEAQDMLALIQTKPPMFFLLTNSRAMSEEVTRQLHLDLAKRLQAVAEQTGRRLEVISRSDSTLRGHYPLETDTLSAAWPGLADLTLIMPFFAEGGRLTIEGQHYVCQGDQQTPAHETPFARDPVFGYQNSFLPKWVQEKTTGRVAAADVVVIGLQDIRQGGPERVRAILDQAALNAVVVADSATDQDAYVVADGVGRSSRKVMARTAASYVRARAGLERRPLMSGADLRGTGDGGLTVVGSHVPKSTAQLAALRNGLPELVAIEIEIDAVLANAENVVETISASVNESLTDDRDVVLFTSRKLKTGLSDQENLEISSVVSACVSGIVGNVSARPRYLIGKGGITSSDLATKSLRVKLATVAGSILPGIPVWRLGAETRFPGLNYVIFPGNVGDDNALLAAVQKLRGR
jgi:uncharacterized protein YgbK (DUF1537 family)